MPSGQSGFGIPWSVYEDQALVVLVHDLGPNWELVSDAINSTLQFKRIFRKPKECKERCKELMDRNGCDGTDNADDLWSSEPYPSTLPGIPKGSARQLLQRLQGPMEEDSLKIRFEKIILIMQQLPSRWDKAMELASASVKEELCPVSHTTKAEQLLQAEELHVGYITAEVATY